MLSLFAASPRFVAVLALIVTLASCAAPVEKSGPNVIVILTDDQPADLTAFMPTVQRELADKGVVFSEAFTTNTLCCPARVSVLRGQYVHNHAVLSNGGPQGGFPKFYQTGFEASTLATWLQDAGYHTAMMGKYLNAYPFGPAGENPPDYRPPRHTYVPPGWNEWFGFFDVPKDSRNTPYRMYDYSVNHNGRVEHYGNRERDYQTDVLSRRANEFIRRQGRSSDPFFLYLAPTAPHLPTVVARRHQGALAGLKAPRSPAFDEADMSDKPRWLRRLPQLSGTEIAEIDDIYRKQAEMLLAVDELVGALLETLRTVGQLHNTYLVFTSDHGWHAGEHRLTKMKLTPYAAAARIPLIIRGPGLPEGKTLEQLALNIDIAPTLTELLGVKHPEFVDGRSLKPLWSSETPRWRQTALTEFWPRRTLEDYDLEHLNTRVAVPQYRAVRSQRHLYVEYRYRNGNTEGELYDLERDPFELENLYSRTDPELLSAFAAHAERLQACSGQSCREAENAAPEGL